MQLKVACSGHSPDVTCFCGLLGFGFSDPFVIGCLRSIKCQSREESGTLMAFAKRCIYPDFKVLAQSVLHGHQVPQANMQFTQFTLVKLPSRGVVMCMPSQMMSDLLP